MVVADTVQGPLFDERVHDFGTVQEQDGVMSHRFRFTNRSDRPVVVTQALTSCQCIRAEWQPEPVLPGADGVLTVSYDPSHRPGTFSKEIRILFDGGQTVRRIWIRGEVIPCRHPVAEDHPYDLGRGLRTNLRVLLLGGIPAGEEGGILFRYGNASQQTLRLSPLELTAVALPPKRPVTASAPVAVCPQRSFLFGRSAAPQPFAIRIGNRGASPLHILHADLPPEVESDLRAGAEIAPGESRTFAATLRGGVECHDRIYLVTDDPARPLVTITLNTKTEKND